MLDHQQAENAAQSPATQPKLKCSWKRREGSVFLLMLLFSLIFSVVYWCSSIQPYATLNIGEEGHFVLFSPDSKSLITAGKEDFGRKAGPLRMWDVERGIERFSVAGDWKQVETVHFSPDSRLFAAHEKRNLKLWSTATGEEVTRLDTQTRFGNWMNFRFSPDGMALVFQGYSKEKEFGEYGITFWDIEHRKELGSVGCYFWTLAFAPDGRSFGTFTRKDHQKVDRIMLWRWEPTQAPVLAQEYSIATDYVAFSPDLTTFATAEVQEVILWDMATGEKRSSAKFDGNDTHLQSLSFEANGGLLVAHGGGGWQLDWHWATTVWDVRSGLKEIGSFSETPAVSPDGKWLAIPLDKGVSLLRSSPKEDAGVKLLNCATLEEGNDLSVPGDVSPTHFGMYNNMKCYPKPHFAPDGEAVVVTDLISQGQASYLSKWLPTNFNPFRGHQMDSVVRVWEVPSGREIMAFRNCSEAHFSPDGKVLATLHEGNTIKLWHWPLRKPLWTILGLSFAFWSVPSLLFFLIARRRKLAT